MADSFVQAFDDELEAFSAFAEIYSSTVLLVDIYDTLEGCVARSNSRTGSATTAG